MRGKNNKEGGRRRRRRRRQGAGSLLERHIDSDGGEQGFIWDYLTAYTHTAAHARTHTSAGERTHTHTHRCWHK